VACPDAARKRPERDIAAVFVDSGPAMESDARDRRNWVASSAVGSRTRAAIQPGRRDDVGNRLERLIHLAEDGLNFQRFMAQKFNDDRTGSIELHKLLK
jgi:hypothetical protein